MTSTIFLIGLGGAARTTDPAIAHAFETVAGYTRCTRAQYNQTLREISALDTSVALSQRHDLQHTIDGAAREEEEE